MPSFGNRSLSNLAECHPDLQRVAHEAIKWFDFAVIDGQRGRAEQTAALQRGTSRAIFGQSPHNYAPSLAMDCAPWPLDWDDEKRFRNLAVVMLKAAVTVDVKIEWGGNFRFFDGPHFQLAGWRGMIDGVDVKRVGS